MNNLMSPNLRKVGTAGRGTKDFRDTKDNLKSHYQKRSTIFDYVKENMAMVNRSTYYQRIIYTAKLISESADFLTKLQQIYENILEKCKENLFGEKISGIFLFYEGYSIVMIEGSEEVLWIFLKNLQPHIPKLFELSSVLHFLNNIYQVFFEKVVWRTAMPPVLMRNLMSVQLDDFENHNRIILRKLYLMCTKVSEEIEKDGAPYTTQLLSHEYNTILPMTARMDIMMLANKTPTLLTFVTLSLDIPDYEDYEQSIWPVPFDYIPRKLFVYRDYDVNITFTSDTKKNSSENTRRSLHNS